MFIIRKKEYKQNSVSIYWAYDLNGSVTHSGVVTHEAENPQNISDPALLVIVLDALNPQAKANIEAQV